MRQAITPACLIFLFAVTFRGARSKAKTPNAKCLDTQERLHC
jgi:hypothetical protein